MKWWDPDASVFLSWEPHEQYNSEINKKESEIENLSESLAELQKDTKLKQSEYKSKLEKANRWGNMEIVRDFIFLGSKITADGDCSHEIKRCLLLGRKAMTNLDSVLKSRDITLLTKVCIVKAMVFQ